MRASYFVSAPSGVLPLNADLLENLGLGPQSHVYALPILQQDSAILSVIPPSHWHCAFRVVVYTHSAVGSLHSAARALAKKNISLLDSWAAATSSRGELCWTSIVNYENSNGKKDDELKLREIVQETLAKGRQKPLSRNTLGNVIPTHFPIHVVRLRVLGGLHELFGDNATFQGNIESNQLNLSKVKGPQGDGSLWDALRRIHRDEAEPQYALLSPDTEERYIRLALLPRSVDLRRVSFCVDVQSDVGRFAGCFRESLRVIRDRKYNIFSARNTLVSKRESDCGESSTERALFAFDLDVQKDSLPGYASAEFGRSLVDDIQKKLMRLEKKLVGSARIDLDTVRVVVPVEDLPRCYFASNIKRGLGYGEDALRVYHALRALDLNPVNVDVAPAALELRSSVQTLLEVCPILVSFMLPEEGNLLSEGAGKGQWKYACSDWVAFEEAFMLARGRPVSRIRHVDVRPPSYSGSLREFRFSSGDDLPEAIEEMSMQVRRELASIRWAETLRECDEVWSEGGYREVPGRPNLGVWLGEITKDEFRE